MNKCLSVMVIAFAALFGACTHVHAQFGPPVCNVSNSQVNGYVLTATSTGGHLCAWQAGGGGGGGAVSSVFGRTGAVVANTGDYTVSQITGAAPLASPSFTGNPTAPTQLGTDNSTRLATTAFVQALVGSGGCPTCILATPTNHGVIISSATQTANVSTAGTVGQAFISGGSSADGAYAALNLAGGSSVVTGILPAVNLPTATSAAKGVIQGDGSTITISSGVAACTTATNSQLGCARPDGTTVTIAAGVLTAHLSGGAVSGTGTANFIPVWNGTSSLTNSSIQDNGSAITTSEQITSAGLISTSFIQAGGNITALSGGDFNCGTGCLGYYVGGTQVIDPSRDLNNIANINETGTLNVTGSGFFTGGINSSTILVSSTVAFSGLAAGSGSDSVLCISSGSIVHKGGCAAGIGGSGFTGFVPVFTSGSAIGNSSIQDNGSQVSTSEQIQAAGLISTGFIQASGNITALSGGDFNCGTGCPGYYVAGTQVIDSSRDLNNIANINEVGTLNVTGAGFFSAGVNAASLLVSGTVAFSGLTAGSGGSIVCVNAGILYKGGCGSGTSAPLVVGSNSFTGAQAFQAIGAGSFNNTVDWSPNVGLLGPAATSTTACYEHFHPFAMDHIVRESAGHHCAIAPVGDTDIETNGETAMTVAYAASTNAVALSGFAISAVTNGSAWGINTLLRDYDNEVYGPGQQWASDLQGWEADLSIADPNTKYTGANFNIERKSHWSPFSFGGTSPATIGINFVGITNSIPIAAYFDIAYATTAGAALVGLALGAQPAFNAIDCSGCDATNSQYIQFTNNAHFGHIFSNGTGGIVLAPDVGHTGNTLVVSGATGNVVASSIIQSNAVSATALYAPSGQLYTAGSGTNTMLGSLSIGTSLTVNGTGQVNSSLSVFGQLLANNTGNNIINGTLIQGTSGNVIINGSYPSQVDVDQGNKLQANGVSGVAGGNAYIVTQAFGGTTEAFLGADNFSHTAFFGSTTNSPTVLRVANVERFRIDTSGNVSIGGNLTAGAGSFSATGSGVSVTSLSDFGSLSVFGTTTVQLLNANNLSLFALGGTFSGSKALCLNGTTVTVSSTNVCPP